MELFPGEALDFSSSNDPTAHLLSENEINEKYAKGLERIVTEQARYPLATIVGMINSGNYELKPEFQRRYRWDAKRQSRLIESFIMNVPIPPIFLYEDRYSHYEVMDGLQRLTAIFEFYTDVLVLEGLDQWPELNKRRYSQLPDQVRRGIDRRYLSSIILLQETAKDEAEAQRLKQLVFERINSGGVKLEAQESRNAIYNGPLNELCIKLSRNRYLCKCWGIPEPTKDELENERPSKKLQDNEDYRKMNDVELVLRFFAYRQRLNQQKSGNLSIYLDNFLKYGNKWDKDVRDGLEDLFEKTIQLVYEVFEEKAFWVMRPNKSKWSWYKRPTTVVYDPLMFAFSQHIEKRKNIILAKDIFRSNIVELYKSHYKSFDGRYTNISNLRERNGLFVNYILASLQKYESKSSNF